MYETGFSDKLGDLWIGVIFASGVLAFASSVALFFSTERGKWPAAALYVLGGACLWFACLMALSQTVQHRTPSGIPGFPDTVTTEPRHEVVTRYLIYVALVLFPIFAAQGLLFGRSVAQTRLKGTYVVHMKNGFELFRQRSYEEAIAEFSRAIAVDPDRAEAYSRRGRAYLHRGELGPALSDFNQALAIDPQLSEAYLHRAEVHAERGFHDLALGDFDMSLNLQPNLPEGYLSRGFCRIKQGNPEGAVDDFRRVLQLTNNVDFTDPARRSLQQLGAV